MLSQPFAGVFRNPRRRMRRLIACSTVLLIFSAALCSRGAETNGFAVTFTSADRKSRDIAVLPNLWLFVGKGTPATPFLPPGKFTAEFNGFISADLRATYYFGVEQLAGALKLEVNGNTVLDVQGTGGPTELSKAVQLNKGPNAVKATFTGTEGDSFVRVGWTEKGTNLWPIPNAWITQARTPETQNAERLHLGRELFLEHRCAKCHAIGADSVISELAMDAPSFDGIGTRRRVDWLSSWVLDPKTSRAQVFMPKMLHGPTAKEDAAAIAVYLASLRGDAPTAKTDKPTAFEPNEKATTEVAKRSGANAKPTLAGGAELPDAGGEKKSLFERLHCNGCHAVPGSEDPDSTKISLQHVGLKFAEGQLAEFLKAPERHFAWIRMPNFKLADVEANELATYLLKAGTQPKADTVSTDKAVAERGEKLVQSLGCLACHSYGKTKNTYAAAPLAKIAAELKGCLAAQHGPESKAPDYAFDAVQREALVAFLKTDRSSLLRETSMEFAARQTRALQCNACHGQIDLVPPLELLGGKLKPEWTAAFLAGAPFKVRGDIHPKGGDWIPARMPAFRSRARMLAEGMAAEQGYGPKTAAESPIDEAAAKIGHKMIGKDNGLSCISCHAVNDLPALEVFESEGINLGFSAARLLKPYFFRWMRNPLAIDPGTKMPAFFGEDGKSALTDYYEGDGEKQINALYQYIRMAEKMPKPNTGEAQ